jgi:hypothetical protein
MFASLRNKFSNYRKSLLRFDIEKNIIIEAFDRFGSLRFGIHGDFSFKRSMPTPRIIDIGSR